VRKLNQSVYLICFTRLENRHIDIRQHEMEYGAAELSNPLIPGVVNFTAPEVVSVDLRTPRERTASMTLIRLSNIDVHVTDRASACADIQQPIL